MSAFFHDEFVPAPTYLGGNEPDYLSAAPER
jgi:hypothetical protein